MHHGIVTTPALSLYSTHAMLIWCFSVNALYFNYIIFRKSPNCCLGKCTRMWVKKTDNHGDKVEF